VTPINGKCPDCGRTLKGSSLNRKHPVNIKRVDHYRAKFTADYQPNTEFLRTCIDGLAQTRERLDVTKAGSADYTRLVNDTLRFGAALEESRLSRDSRTPTDYDSLSTAQIRARLQQMLDAIPADVPIPTTPLRAAGLPVTAEAEPCGETPEPTPAPAPKCPWCGQTPCVGRDHHSYDALHSQDPEHVEARQKKQDAEMYASFARQRKGWMPPQW
jgi:hypothetical protein